MKSIYEELQPEASRLMKEFKQGSVVYVKITPGTGTADNPGESTEEKIDLDATVKGVSWKYLQTGFAKASDKTVSCAVVAGLIPSEKDFIEIDGERFKIHADISSPAAGTRVIWKFIVRKGG